MFTQTEKRTSHDAISRLPHVTRGGQRSLRTQVASSTTPEWSRNGCSCRCGLLRTHKRCDDSGCTCRSTGPGARLTYCPGSSSVGSGVRSAHLTPLPLVNTIIVGALRSQRVPTFVDQLAITLKLPTSASSRPALRVSWAAKDLADKE